MAKKLDVNNVSIPDPADLSPDYAAAVRRRDELRDALRQIDEQGQELRRQEQAERDRDAAAELLESDNVTDAVAAAPAESLRRDIEALASRRRVVAEALQRAEQRVKDTERQAARLVGAEVAGEWEAILKRQAAAVAELAASIDAYDAFQARLPASAEQCGLRQAALLGVLGPKLGAAVRRMHQAGYLSPDDVSSRWLK